MPKAPSSGKRISVAIVEDDVGISASLAALIEHAPDLRCVASYTTGEEALEKMPALAPQVALVDINLGKMNGIECVRRLKLQLPAMQVLMITAFEDAKMVFQALKAGANGYLLKRNLTSELIAAVENVCAGGAPMSQQVARKVVGFFHADNAKDPDMESLSPREHDVLAHLAQGRMYKEIADLMSISINTVRAHVTGIYGKLHVQSRMGAVNKYLGR
jgi:DNA-binding NarL/FixJ family response regulator